MTLDLKPFGIITFNLKPLDLNAAIPNDVRLNGVGPKIRRVENIKDWMNSLLLRASDIDWLVFPN